MMRLIIFILLFATLASSCVVEARTVDDRITVEQLIVMHLEAIGTAEARRGNRSRIVAGDSIMNLAPGDVALPAERRS